MEQTQGRILVSVEVDARSLVAFGRAADTIRDAVAQTVMGISQDDTLGRNATIVCLDVETARVTRLISPEQAETATVATTPAVVEDDDDAPYGRKADGTPKVKPGPKRAAKKTAGTRKKAKSRK